MFGALSDRVPCLHIPTVIYPVADRAEHFSPMRRPGTLPHSGNNSPDLYPIQIRKSVCLHDETDGETNL